mmetsp:Transcript_95412/g.246614  ORF Transcript_95412/g.246614 Transcript_95412/m.246614 type:complete len:301 (+) Transcript_95412:235-1137(+)
MEPVFVVVHADPGAAPGGELRAPRAALLAEQAHLSQLAHGLVQRDGQRQGVMQLLAARLPQQVVVHGAVQELEGCPPRRSLVARRGLRHPLRRSEGLVQPLVVDGAVAHVLGHQDFAANRGALQRVLRRLDVAAEVPRRACRQADELRHLQLPRHHALAGEAALRHPAADAEVPVLQSGPEVVQRSACHQSRALVATGAQHAVGGLAVLLPGLQPAEALVELSHDAALVKVARPVLRTDAHASEPHLRQQPPDQRHLLLGARRARHGSQLHGRVSSEQQQREHVVRVAGLHVEDVRLLPP